MLNKLPDIKTIKNHPAHRQIIYSKLHRSEKPSLRDLSINKLSFVNISVDISRKNRQAENSKNQSISIIPHLSKSPE